MRRGTMIGLAFGVCLWALSAHAASVGGSAHHRLSLSLERAVR